MQFSCCVFLCTHARYNVLVFQKIGFFLGGFQKMLWFSKKLGVSKKNLGCPGIFREIKGNTPKCPGRQTSQVGMYVLYFKSLTVMITLHDNTTWPKPVHPLCSLVWCFRCYQKYSNTTVKNSLVSTSNLNSM